MNSLFPLAAIVVVAVLHLGFMILEATQWARPLGLRLHHLSESTARETTGVAKNMAIYNGFIGILLLWVTFALGAGEAYSAQWLILAFIVFAGAIGAFTIRNRGIFLLQSVPALLALALIWADRPYPRNETEAIPEIARLERQILAVKSVDKQPSPKTAGEAVPRGQHPKMHGLVSAKFTVASGLPEEMRVGLFANPGKEYDALIRYSNARNPDDRDRGGHGMSIKLLGVETPSGGGTRTQDIILFDSPVFFVADPVQYVEFEQATLRALGKSKAGTLATVFLGYYWRHPHQFLNLLKTQRGDVTDPLAIRYWSVTPYRLGKSIIKYSARPTDDGAPVVVARSKDMLRQAMEAHLEARDAVFEFQVQVQSDPAAMPEEDPTVEWSERASIPRTVATIVIPARQRFATPRARSHRGEPLVHSLEHTCRARTGGGHQPRPQGRLRVALRVSPRPEPHSAPGAR